MHKSFFSILIQGKQAKSIFKKKNGGILKQFENNLAINKFIKINACLLTQKLLYKNKFTSILSCIYKRYIGNNLLEGRIKKDNSINNNDF